MVKVGLKAWKVKIWIKNLSYRILSLQAKFLLEQLSISILLAKAHL